MDLPLPEAVTKNEDDSYTIFINPRLSAEDQRTRVAHALKHIMGDDFYKEDADKIEFNAHSA